MSDPSSASGVPQHNARDTRPVEARAKDLLRDVAYATKTTMDESEHEYWERLAEKQFVALENHALAVVDVSPASLEAAARAIHPLSELHRLTWEELGPNNRSHKMVRTILSVLGAEVPE